MHDEAVDEARRCGHRVYERPSRLAIPALFHDAHEAYTNDLTSPLKAVLAYEAPGVLRDIQDRLDSAIAEHFGFDASALKSTFVKAVDDLLLFREAAGLKYSHGIGEHWGNDEYYEPLAAYGWTPAEAERRFIETYERLTNGRSDT